MSCCTDQAPMRMTLTKETDRSDHLVSPVKLACQKNCEKCKEKKEPKQTNEKKLALALSLFFLTISAWAQDEPAAKSFWDDPINHPMAPLYLVTALVFVTVTLALVVAIYVLRILKLFLQQSEKEKAVQSGKAYVPQPSWWQSTWDKWNAAVPVAKEQDIDLGHDFDGIRELDNHLPPWWKGLFYLTILFAIVYLSVYHLSNTLPLSLGEYQNEQEAAAEQARIYRASQPAAVIDENKLVYTPDQAILAKGKSVFLGSCVPCHKNDGGGNTIGPNLTDEYWLHGGGIKNVFSTIKNGVVEKGMPAWGKTMSAQDVRDVAFYILSLQGTNPANAKAPQGELFKPDSTQVVAAPQPISN